MKKKGFVSTSLIYTFFIIFLLLMLFLLNSYSRIRFLLEDYKYDIKESFANLSIADINIYFMVWNSTTDEYELADSMPSFGFNYESEFSYCKNGSKMTYQGGNIMVTSNRRDSCYAYFKELEKDIILNIYTKESEDSTRKLVQSIPNANYVFTGYNCTNGAELTFDETTRKFKITSESKTVCSVDFTRRESDITFRIFKEDASGTEIYDEINFKEVSDIPESDFEYYGYSCNNNTEIFTDDNGDFFANATGKDVCKLYFTSGSNRVKISIMQETETGVDGLTTGIKYTEVYQVPGTGYEYVGYYCDDSRATVTYNNGILTGEAEAGVRTTCRAYFDKLKNAVINYYLETTSGEYESVTSVPEYGYVFKEGNCTYGSNYEVYNNYVVVSAVNSNEVCNFYYNQTSSDIKVLVFVWNGEKYELSSMPSYSPKSTNCTNGATIEYVDNKLKVTAAGPTVCTVYFGG